MRLPLFFCVKGSTRRSENGDQKEGGDRRDPGTNLR